MRNIPVFQHLTEGIADLHPISIALECVADNRRLPERVAVVKLIRCFQFLGQRMFFHRLPAPIAL